MLKMPTTYIMIGREVVYIVRCTIKILPSACSQYERPSQTGVDLALVEPAEDLVVELLVDVVLGIRLVDLELHRALEELGGLVVVLEHGQHDLAHVGLEGEQLERLHHEPAEALPLVVGLQLDLVDVEDLAAGQSFAFSGEYFAQARQT